MLGAAPGFCWELGLVCEGMDGCCPPGPPGACAKAVTPARSAVAEHIRILLPIVIFVSVIAKYPPARGDRDLELIRCRVIWCYIAFGFFANGHLALQPTYDEVSEQGVVFRTEWTRELWSGEQGPDRSALIGDICELCTLS